MGGKKIIMIVSGVLLFLLLLFVGYAGWNAANPRRTCASCHEIVPSFETWQRSAHREVTCVDCHGTTLENGFHSLRENARMILTHVSRPIMNDEIDLSEGRVVEVMESCTECHQSEYKNWLAGGHSANYGEIFLNETHNSLEQPYWDCLRCHGMYYDGNIYDLVEPVSIHGPWSLKDPDMSPLPTIPCLACHQVHGENEVLKRPRAMDEPEAIFYEREPRNPVTSLYVRSDRISLRADQLTKPDMYLGERKVVTSDDPVQRLCIQCHSPDWEHTAGSSDDRTPTGVHEGISCMACHEPHSNDARNSCSRCHPALSNCGLDVETMNTTFLSRESPNNIHHVACEDCHETPVKPRTP
jgi:hypothetical protein